MNSRALVSIAALVLFTVALGSCGSPAAPARQLTSMTVKPHDADALAPGGNLPFSATGSFDQTPMTETNLPAQWVSSDSTVATVDPNSGLAICVATGGPITITASAQGKTASANFTCLSSQPESGNCVYVCGSTRCGELTGYCESSGGGACRQGYDPVHCQPGQPAKSMETDACGAGVDTSRSCTP
jgi:Bacterial Ig-like domain (group 2)